jgi:hypothetical protein
VPSLWAEFPENRENIRESWDFSHLQRPDCSRISHFHLPLPVVMPNSLFPDKTGKRIYIEFPVSPAEQGKWNIFIFPIHENRSELSFIAYLVLTLTKMCDYFVAENKRRAG